jgi:hypothetical protein
VGVIKKKHGKYQRKCIESVKESNKEISPVSGVYPFFERGNAPHPHG